MEKPKHMPSIESFRRKMFEPKNETPTPPDLHEPAGDVVQIFERSQRVTDHRVRDALKSRSSGDVEAISKLRTQAEKELERADQARSFSREELAAEVASDDDDEAVA